MKIISGFGPVQRLRVPFGADITLGVAAVS
jgi:hypothetical protein